MLSIHPRPRSAASRLALSLLTLGALGVGVAAQLPSPVKASDLGMPALDALDFQSATGPTGGEQLGRAVAMGGDVNGDGHADLFLGAPYASAPGNQDGIAYVLFGGPGFTMPDLSTLDGTNGFRIVSPNAGSRMGFAVVSPGDLNGDGIAEIAVGAPAAAVLLGYEGAVHVVFGAVGIGAGGTLDVGSLDGTNGFTMYGKDANESFGETLASVGDIDGDGSADLLIGAPGAGVHDYQYPLTQDPVDVVTGDLNGDGIVDIVVSRGDWDLASVLYGAGDGTISLETTYSISEDPRELVLADVDNDGDLDLIAEAEHFDTGLSKSIGRIAVLPNVGLGLLGAQQNYDVANQRVQIALGDLNEDGFVDMAALHGAQSNPTQAFLQTLTNDGTGTFVQSGDLPVGINPGEIAMGYVDGDSHLDVAFSAGTSVVLYVGDGTGVLTPSNAVTTQIGLEELRCADLNSDGFDDLFGIPGVSVVLSNGDGTLQDPVLYFTTNDTQGIEFGDVTGDGAGDLVGADGSHVQVIPGVGDGTFKEDHQILAGGRVTDLVLADLDGDLDLDICTSEDVDENLTFFFNNGDGTYGAPSRGAAYLVYGGPSIGVGGTVDVAALNGSDGLKLLGRDGGDNAGRSVGSAGDWNFDGAADLAVGASFANPVEASEGEIYAYFGGGRIGSGAQVLLGDFAPLGGARFRGGLPQESLGRAVDGAGDFDGDGMTDLALGAPNAEDAGVHVGKAWLAKGGLGLGVSSTFTVTDLDGTNGFAFVGANDEDKTGDTLAFAGDTNASGFDDLLIGSPLFGDRIGRAHLLYGGPSVGSAGAIGSASIDDTNGCAIWGANIDDELAHSVAGGADVDGDGFDDILIGARGVDAPSNFMGRVYLLPGRDSHLSADTSSISLLLGNPQTFTANAGASRGGYLYGVAGSLSGTTPGFDLDGLHIPLNLDAYFFLSVGSSSPIVAGVGLLDSVGQAMPVFDIPPGLNPSLIGTSVNHAFITLHPVTTAITTASNPVSAQFSF